VVNATARPLYPRERDPGPVVQDAGWAPGPVWTGAENLATIWMRSPNRPTRSDPLNRLSYRGPPNIHKTLHVCDLRLQIKHNAYEGTLSVSEPSEVTWLPARQDFPDLSEHVGALYRTDTIEAPSTGTGTGTGPVSNCTV